MSETRTVDLTKLFKDMAITLEHLQQQFIEIAKAHERQEDIFKRRIPPQ